jgi:hypothetical protein
MSALGSLLGGLFANLPFIIAPPTSISIFLSLYLQDNGYDANVGNSAVALSGLLLICLGWRPLSVFCNRVSNLSSPPSLTFLSSFLSRSKLAQQSVCFIFFPSSS